MIMTKDSDDELFYRVKKEASMLEWDLASIKSKEIRKLKEGKLAKLKEQLKILSQNRKIEEAEEV